MEQICFAVHVRVFAVGQIEQTGTTLLDCTRTGFTVGKMEQTGTSYVLR